MGVSRLASEVMPPRQRCHPALVLFDAAVSQIVAGTACAANATRSDVLPDERKRGLEVRYLHIATRQWDGSAVIGAYTWALSIV